MKDTTKLINSLKEYMKEYDYTQRDIASKLCVHESTVSRWLNGGNIINQHCNAIKFLITGELNNSQESLTNSEKMILEKLKTLNEVEQAEVNLFISKLKDKRSS